MLVLFQAFSLRCEQIDEAIRLGDDARVSALDCSIEPLIETILAHKAVSLLEIHMQLQFVGCLIDQYADDSDSVREHVALLSYLIEQYFGGSKPRWRMPRVREAASEPFTYAPNTDNGNFLNAAILESIPDRVAVLTKDYRYLYSNAANSAYLGRKPMDMIGHHLMEFIGEKRFTEVAKAKLDACFSGQQADYEYGRCDGGLARQVRCRMSPLRDSLGYIIGALIILQDTAASAATLAA
ncbi:PAS domain-containing protein [Rhizobium sp. Root1220]|uniref:PAS domain-containing protein n=1 Tax=Rhizobium sp. Root1220 TaxID=1736432 RepID=UPI0006FA58C7|nr:PAS domain-containing protein [Rhizobium sp. Root1220]KQV81841.1 diguanylate cyclase [Rhizobium sp. Root1220]